jgi:hypothetical protein
MKIGGVPVTKCEEVLVLPRPNGGDLVFKAIAVTDMEPFEALCPKPTAPVRLTKDGKEPNVNSPNYMSQVEEWANRRHCFIIIHSLKPSDIEWDTVEDDKPSTWSNWLSDLENAGLCGVECQRVQQCVIDANALNEAKLREARDAFLRGQGKQ